MGDNKPVYLCIMLKNSPVGGIAKLYIYHLIHYDWVGGTKAPMETKSLTIIMRQITVKYYGVFFSIEVMEKVISIYTKGIVMHKTLPIDICCHGNLVKHHLTENGHLNNGLALKNVLHGFIWFI